MAGSFFTHHVSMPTSMQTLKLRSGAMSTCPFASSTREHAFPSENTTSQVPANGWLVHPAQAPWPVSGLVHIPDVWKLQRGVGKEQAAVDRTLTGRALPVPCARPNSVRNSASGACRWVSRKDGPTAWGPCAFTVRYQWLDPGAHVINLTLRSMRHLARHRPLSPPKDA